MSAQLVLAILAALAIWIGSLYVHPFGRCPKCKGAGTVKRLGRVRVCPRCKGQRRAQRPGSRHVHQLARRVRHGWQAAGQYTQEDSHEDA